jgi:hypothetical protein
MSKKIRSLLMICTTAAAMLVAADGACAEAVTFDDNPLSPNSFWTGADGSGGFTSGSASFNNSYTDWGGGYYSWDGWAYSNMADTTSPGYGNQYSAIPGGGQGDSSQYGVAYVMTWGASRPTMTLSDASSPRILAGAWFTNTTLTYLSMLNGDIYGGKKFGGDTGNDSDWFLLTITGLNAAGNPDKTVNFYLADFRNENGVPDYIINQWTWVDLSPLGAVGGLKFDLSSSDVGANGIMTPTYFAMDTLIPEPATIGLLGLGILICNRRTKRNHRK